jgi:hypothetical protein
MAASLCGSSALPDLLRPQFSPENKTEDIFIGNALTDQLKRVIESRLGGVASFVRSMRVAPAGREPSEWDGVVHLFDLQNNPQARRAYAWSSPIRGSNAPRYFAVLHMNRVNGPAEAVKAAAAAMRAAK